MKIIGNSPKGQIQCTHKSRVISSTQLDQMRFETNEVNLEDLRTHCRFAISTIRASHSGNTWQTFRQTHDRHINRTLFHIQNFRNPGLIWNYNIFRISDLLSESQCGMNQVWKMFLCTVILFFLHSLESVTLKTWIDKLTCYLCFTLISSCMFCHQMDAMYCWSGQGQALHQAPLGMDIAPGKLSPIWPPPKFGENQPSGLKYTEAGKLISLYL